MTINLQTKNLHPKLMNVKKTSIIPKPIQNLSINKYKKITIKYQTYKLNKNKQSNNQNNPKESNPNLKKHKKPLMSKSSNLNVKIKTIIIKKYNQTHKLKQLKIKNQKRKKNEN